jgi:hypothetical protein
MGQNKRRAFVLHEARQRINQYADLFRRPGNRGHLEVTVGPWLCVAAFRRVYRFVRHDLLFVSYIPIFVTKAINFREITLQIHDRDVWK